MSYSFYQPDKLYFSAYGERVPERNAASQAPRNVLRDEMLMKILMKGLQPKIIDAMWPRLSLNYTHAIRRHKSSGRRRGDDYRKRIK